MSRSYLSPQELIRKRYNWFAEAKRLSNVSLACKRLGISRKSFYKWRSRFKEAKGNPNSLLDRSRRPYRSPRRIGKGMARVILRLRQRTHLGPLRLWDQLRRHPGLRGIPSPFGIYRVLKRAGLVRERKKRPKRYRRSFIVPRPGDLLQVDVKYLPYLVEGRRLYQYTAIDCHTRLRVVQIHEELAIHVAKCFLQYVLSSFPFKVRMVQTDNDSIFTHWYTAGPKTPLDRPVKEHPVTKTIKAFGASHRLIPPRTPRLNGKVERSHGIDDDEFYNLRRYQTRRQLELAFKRWLFHYNHTRPHMGLNGKTPLQTLRAFSQYQSVKEIKP